MTKIQAAVFAVVVLGVAGIPLWVQHQNQVRTAEENNALRQQVEQLATQNEQLSNQIANAAAMPAADTDQQHELLKLRGEVAGLKRDLASAEAKAKAQRVQPAPEQQHTPEEEAAKAVAIAKLNYMKGWMMAFANYAQQHGGLLPTDFPSAAALASEDLTNQTMLAPEQFDIVYNGSLNEVTNPASLIVIRERDASQARDGGWFRAYGFADGHSEIHKANDGNFQPWEAQHMIPPPPATAGQ